jgi:hypothetical protein
MKLGDSIVAATALAIGAELVTRNVDDFRHVAELRVSIHSMDGDAGSPRAHFPVAVNAGSFRRMKRIARRFPGLETLEREFKDYAIYESGAPTRD